MDSLDHVLMSAVGTTAMLKDLTPKLADLECISLADISALPEANQHVIAERLEEPQDELRKALQTHIHSENHYLVNI